MTVSIDPSEVRGDRAAVKPPAAAPSPGFRLPLRAVLAGGLGGAGLIAFTVGAFSFFSGLADPRALPPRVLPAAVQMPDLKDGVPALAGETAAPPVQTAGLRASDAAAVEPRTAPFNLPRPATDAPAPQARIEPPRPQAAAARRDGPERSRPAAAPMPAAPQIQNAAVLPETRTAPVIAPARAETVTAKAGPSTFASLPAEPGTGEAARRPAAKSSSAKSSSAKLPEAKPPEAKTPEAKTPEVKAPEVKAPEPKPSGPRSPEKATSAGTPGRKVAAQRSATRQPAAETAAAAPAPQQTARAGSDETEVLGVPIPGGRQLRDGIKAIGGLFGSGE